MGAARPAGPPAASLVSGTPAALTESRGPCGFSAVEIYCSRFCGLEGPGPGAGGLGFWSSSRSGSKLPQLSSCRYLCVGACLGRALLPAGPGRFPFAAHWGGGGRAGEGSAGGGDRRKHPQPPLPAAPPSPALLVAPWLLTVSPVRTQSSPTPAPAFQSPRPLLCTLLLFFLRGPHGQW